MQTGCIKTTSYFYQFSNLVGAACLTYSVIVPFNTGFHYRVQVVDLQHYRVRQDRHDGAQRSGKNRISTACGPGRISVGPNSYFDPTLGR